MKLRIGILSTASIVPRFIGAVRAADKAVSSSSAGSFLTEGCTVAALASRSYETASEKARLWNIPSAYGNYEDLIHSPDIDVIYIAAINSEHYRFVKAALEAGKHVLCEKPFTLDPGQARELFSLARKNRLFLMEMQKTVFLPVIQKLKKIIQIGEFGKITMADFSSSFDSGYNSWFFDASKGGGPLYGNASYSLQLMQYLLDSRASEWMGLCTRSHTGVEDQFSLTVRMKNDTLYTNKTSMRSETIHTGYLYGEKGYIEIPDYWKARKAILHYHAKEPHSVILEEPCEFELMYEIMHAEQCIRQGMTESPVMTEEMTISTIEVLTNLNRQWYSSRD